MKEIQQKMQKQLKEMSKGTLFQVNIDRDKVFQIYLDSFSEESRQYYNCNCCKSFLRQYAGIVSIADNKMVSIWDFESTEEYKEAVTNLRKYAKSLPISSLFFSEEKNCGVEKNLDSKREVIWDHFFVKMDSKFVLKDSGSKRGEAESSKQVFKRSLEEISPDSVSTVLELIGDGSLYRGNDYKKMLSDFQKLQADYKKVPAKLKDNFCWKNSINSHVSKIRNTSIGTLLTDLTSGMELDKSVERFEKMVAPSNYKRPTALVTKAMVDNAKKKLEENGYLDSIYRKQLSDVDLDVNDCLFISRDSSKLDTIFDEIADDSQVDPKSLSKVEEIHIEKFIENVVPKAKSIRVLLENLHLNNFVTMVGSKTDFEKNMFKWNNNKSWSYTGGMTDSIKEKVKKAGGNIKGRVRVSLSWYNHDDLDLHVRNPYGQEIYFRNRDSVQKCGGMLDVDMNAGHGTTREPVENIFWSSDPKEGEYTVLVNNYRQREMTNTGFTVEIEFNGDVQTFHSDSNKVSGTVITKFSFSKKGGLKIIGKQGSSSFREQEKWGLKTGRFQKVKALTLSPNYWGKNKTGNKHYFFFLDKCETDEKVRGFYNEFLSKEFDENRKFLEVLGSRVEVEGARNELSGIGFSETIRNHVFVEVEGSFKRRLKVLF